MSGLLRLSTSLRGRGGPPGRLEDDIKPSTPNSHQFHNPPIHHSSADHGRLDAGVETSSGSTTKRKIKQRKTKRNPVFEEHSSSSSFSCETPHANPKSRSATTKVLTSPTKRRKSRTQQPDVRKLPSDVSENKAVKELKAGENEHQKKAYHHMGKRYESYHSNVGIENSVVQTQRKTTPSAPNPTIQCHDSCSPRGAGSRPKAKSQKRVMRAPAPPGSDDGLGNPLDSSNGFSTLWQRQQSDSSILSKHPSPDNSGEFPVPDPPFQSKPKSTTSQDSGPPIRKSLAKAVVAAAVSDATINGRTFSQKDLRSMDAMAQLSSDPVCSRHLQAVGQSFKAKQTGVDDGFAQDGEIKYKIRLLENLFEDASPSSTPNNGDQRRPVDPPGAPSRMLDSGDAKVSSHRSHHQMGAVVLPPRDIDEDVPLIGSDMEKGEGSDSATDVTQRLSSSHRISLSSGSGTRSGRVDEGKATRRIQRLFVLSLALIVGLVITIAVSKVGSNSSLRPTSNAATMPHTAFHQNSLPEYTQQVLLQGGPQNKAYSWVNQDPAITALSAERAIQRFVLATFFYATHGDRWKRSVSWMAYDDECRWYTHVFHTVCNGARRYHTLSLPDNALAGTLPEEMELLSSLNIVQLQDNQLTGKLPRRIWSSWDQLVFLNLYNNSLTGTLPSDVGHLATASNLNTLNLRKNQFMGKLPSELGLLPLEFLSLSDNWFSGALPSELGLLSNAAALYLYDNHFSGTIPTTLGQLSKLTRLELHNNDLSGTVPVELCDLLSTSSGQLTSLSVDCAKVRCACGCDCTKGLSLLQDSLFDAGGGSQ